MSDDRPPRGRVRARWRAAGLAGLAGVAGLVAFGGAAGAVGNDPGRTGQPVPCAADKLIAAIARANGSGGALLTLTQRCTYTLTSAQGPDGLPVVTQPISIDGRGATITRAASAANARIFHVGVGGNLALRDLTVTGGFAPDADGGGGVLVQAGGRATLRDTAVAGNRSVSVGGGIANYGIATVLGRDDSGKASGASSRVDNNSTDVVGGGIFNAGQLTTENADVSGNYSGGQGGGLADTATAVLKKTRIDHNTAAGGGFTGTSGGGVASAFATTKLEDSSVSDNNAGGDGGGISCTSSSIYLRGVRVERNTSAGDGGGIDVDTFPPPLGGPCAAAVEDSGISGNTARGNGGGILNRLSNLTLHRSRVSLNRAIGTASKGGGISNQSGATRLTATQVTQNLSTLAPGGIFTNTAFVTVDQTSVIVANRPTNCSGSGATVPNCFG